MHISGEQDGGEDVSGFVSRDAWDMNAYLKRWIVALVGAAWLLGGSGTVFAQEPQSEPSAAPQAEPQTAPALTAAQLDQLTAPIALYPDPLLGMILTAATYPLEIVEAARWLNEDDHASLQGEALDEALAEQNWDRSVKALVAVPQVLHMMDQNIEWTEQLGNAFLAQQADVMSSVQNLRERASASGQLHSTPQMNVTTEDDEVTIEPADAEVIYVPCYTPVIYGAWPWPQYPPFYFPPPPGYCYPGPYLSFGIGFGVIGPYWGWGRWNWRGHRFYVVPPTRGAPMRPWVHDWGHRRGVPYRDQGTARRFHGPNVPAAPPARGERTRPVVPQRTPYPLRPSSPPRSVPQPMPRPPAGSGRAPPASHATESRPPGGRGPHGRPEHGASDSHPGSSGGDHRPP